MNMCCNWKKQKRKPYLRMLAAGLSLCILLTACPSIPAVFSVIAAENQAESMEITAFKKLPDRVRRQTVSLGTEIEELTLPDTLEVSVSLKDDENSRGGAESSEGSGSKDDEKTPDGDDDTGADKEGTSGDGTGEDVEGKPGENGDGTDEDDDKTSGEDGDGAGEKDDGTSGEGSGDGSTGGNGEETSGDGSGDGGTDDNGDGASSEGSGDDSTDGNGEETSGDGNGNGADKDTAAVDEARINYSTQGAPGFGIKTGSFAMPAYFGENGQGELTVETLTSGAQQDKEAQRQKEESSERSDIEEVATEDIIIEDITWESEPDYDSKTEGVYIFTPVLPEDYTLAEDVSLPEIEVTVQADMEEQVLTAAGELLQEILENYFNGISEDGIYRAILSMDEDTRLDLTADYEEVLAAMTEEDEADERLQSIMDEIQRGIGDAAAKMPLRKPAFLKARAAALQAAGTIPLRRISGSGNAFVYHSFNETKSFTPGKSYAFLNGVYGYDDAVSSLGSGAILKATDRSNNSIFYMQWIYGSSAAVKVYVDVETRGSDFDGCVIGGLYQVPDSGTPTEYRYFCGYGGARNCGPYYAYDYVKEKLTYTDVSASLNDIEKQGSTNPSDYTVKVTFGGSRSMVLDTGSYTVSVPNPDSDEVDIIVSDSEKNQIRTKFRMPLVVNYDGNGTGVSNVPTIQPAWKGERFTVSSMLPVRRGYSFLGWEDAQTGTAYMKGQIISSFGSTSLWLKAQWKDIQAPDVGYTPTQVMTRATDAEVKAAVEEALTITDNEPVEECTVEITVPPNFTATAGDKDVTVKVTDKAGNVTTKTCTVSVMSYVEFSKPVFTADTKNLSVILRNPGTDPVTESGFVWGIMNAPSITINNGKKKTASPVVKADGTISITADNLQKGVTYYARAYIIADGVAYYSDEIEIGIGLPAYGTFTIKNNSDNTFTVTRSGGSEGVQTVYYRTVNGSAVGGTHFTHQADSLTFAAGETAKTITVTEQGVNRVYGGKATTAYTNADRVYSVELYRVTGGGTLGTDAQAQRTMQKGSSYTVDRNVYQEKERSVSTTNDNNIVADRSSSNRHQTFFTNNRGYNMSHPHLYGCYENFNVNRTMEEWSANTNAYLKATAEGYYYRLKFTCREDDDGYEHIWIADHEPNNFNSANEHDGPINIDDNLFGPAKYTARWETNDGQTGTVTVPGTSERSNVYSFNTAIRSGATEGDYVLFGVEDEANIWFSATGKDTDKWRVDSYTDWIKVKDEKEPQLVGVSPMAGGTYKAGDSFTVSLIFDEIVDRQNSGDLNGIVLNTSWGQAKYVGGADTNVLYFTGQIVSNADSRLKVNSFTNESRIKDMCDSITKTATASGSGNTTATVDTAQPNFTLTPKGISGGTGTINVLVNADQTKTNALRYAWSDSASAPANGWVDMTASELSSAKSTAGCALSIRKEPGSGASNGKWYLHVIGTYNTTGATDYKNACVDFGTISAPAAGSEKPVLTVSTDNSAWATQRAITIQTKGGEALKYRRSGETAWKTLALSAGSVTVTANGYYTFMLTAGDDVITRTVQVEKIDRVNPTAEVGALIESGANQTTKAGVYTKITLPVTFADSGSGVKTVQYKWTNTQTTPTSGWQTLPANQVQAGTAQLLYTAAENSETTKYLHLKVTDQVNHTCTVKSAAYKVISQSAVANHAPKITLTGAPTKWINDMVTLQWSLTDHTGKNYEVILPDGRKAKSNTHEGNVWASRNGTYTVKVVDLDYGGESTATVEVTYIDTTAPTVTPSSVSEAWQTGQTVTFTASDSQSGVGKKYYKIVNTKDEKPVEGLKELTADSVSVSQDGVWYIYYKYYDKAGDDSIGRESNRTEGFVGPIKIDTVSPVASVSVGGTPNEQTGWYTAAVPVTLSFEDQAKAEGIEPGGLKSVEYKWVNTKAKPVSGLSALTAAQMEAGEYVNTQTQNGIWYLYYKVTDQAGNMTDGFSEEIRLDQAKAALTVTGPDVGAQKAAGLVLTAASGSFGPSGGVLSVKKDGQWTETTLQESTGSGSLSKAYSVTEPGTYYFYSRTNADKADGAAVSQTRYVHQVTFESNKGSEVAPQLVWTSQADENAGDISGSSNSLVECKVLKPADPSRRGMIFGGWYTDRECGDADAFDFNTQLYEDITLYAKWTAVSYGVTYYLTNPDGSAYEAETSDKNYTFGEGLALPEPKQEGYRFDGWYLSDTYTGDTKTAIEEDETEAKTYYGRYVDIMDPQIAAQLSAESAESGWYTTKPVINLTYSDNHGVEKILVCVDGGEWQELSGFPKGSGTKDETVRTWAFTALQQGDHTYTFRAEDAAGLSATTDEVRVKLDTVQPDLGAVSYNEGYVNLWNWIIRKDSLLVNIPVTEEESGLEKVVYTLTPGSMGNQEPVTKEAKIEKTKTDAGTIYTAVITIDPDYKGVIGDIQAVDAAGNVSETKDVYANGIGVIVEEEKPVITVTADRLPTQDQAGTKPEGEALSEAYYQTAPELLIRVQDGSIAASGIKEVKWRIGSGSENTENGGFADALKTEYGFQIALNGYSGTAQVTILAADNAGNSETKTVTIKIRGKEQKPNAKPDYPTEKLTGLLPNADYVIQMQDGMELSTKADAQGQIVIEDGWFGTEISVIKKGDGVNTEDSNPQTLVLAARPDAPSLGKMDETIKGKKDGQVTGVTSAMEYSTDSGRTWTKADGTLSDTAPGEVWVRVAVTAAAPYGKTAKVTIGEGRTLTVTFNSQGGSEVAPVTGLSWKEAVTRPADPTKEGDNTFVGWYKESAGNNKWHFASEQGADLLTGDVTLFAKWLPRANAPIVVGISYRNELLTELEAGAAYLIGGKEVTASADGTVPIEEDWFGQTIGIIRRGDEINTGDSKALLLPVPDRPTGPEKVAARGESAQGRGDGVLTGLDSTMQYRRAGSTEWLSVTVTELSNLEPGNYELRYVSTDTVFYSKIVTRTINSYSPHKDSGGGKKEEDSDGFIEETPEGDGTEPEMAVKPGEGENPKNNQLSEDDKQPDARDNVIQSVKADRDLKPGDGKKPGNGKKPTAGTGSAGGVGSTAGGITGSGHTVVDDRIVLKSETDAGAAGQNDTGSTADSIGRDGYPYAVGKTVETLNIPVDQGAVVVTVNNKNKNLCTAQAADAVAVANAVLSKEEINLVSKGETIEIRIDVERIDELVDEDEKALIERETAGTGKEDSGLIIGMYVDISMFIRQGEGEWNAVHETNEPVEIIIDVPEELRTLSAEFYIVRAHEGECSLLPDLDETAETITIMTERFSTYAIAYRLTEGADGGGKCSLCHICPTFLGICYFVWLAVILAIGFVVIILLRRKEEEKTQEEGK